MKRFAACLACAALLACLLCAAVAEPALRFDGAYVLHGEGYYTMLRFYEDGDVAEINMDDQAEPDPDWVSRDDEYCSKGKWMNDDGTLHFTTYGEDVAGGVEYTGAVVEDALVLSFYSHINGYQSSEETFSFLPDSVD